MISRLREVLTYVDSHLAINNYFVGNKLTIVDAQAYGLLRWSEKFGLLADYPAISGFLTRMNTLSEFNNAKLIEEQKTSSLNNSHFAGYYDFT